GGYHSGRRKCRGLLLAHIEDVVAALMLCALVMVCVDAGVLQGLFDLAGFRLGSVEAEAAVKILEGAVHEAEAQVAGLEVDEGVLAGFINGVVGGQGLTCEEGGAQSKSGEGFLQHKTVSLRMRVDHFSAQPNMRFRVGTR